MSTEKNKWIKVINQFESVEAPYEREIIKLQKEVERLKGLIYAAYSEAHHKGWMQDGNYVSNFDQFKKNNNL